jgi:predicted  nucleic acid-binding Zn-ribbon protein
VESRAYDREFTQLMKRNGELETENLLLQDRVQRAEEDLRELASVLEVIERIRQRYS